MTLVFRYKNRKLYDTRISNYISFLDLLEYIKTDVNFRVVQYNTKEDITKTVLLRILALYPEAYQYIDLTKVVDDIKKVA